MQNPENPENISCEKFHLKFEKFSTEIKNTFKNIRKNFEFFFGIFYLQDISGFSILGIAIFSCDGISRQTAISENTFEKNHDKFQKF